MVCLMVRQMPHDPFDRTSVPYSNGIMSQEMLFQGLKRKLNFV